MGRVLGIDHGEKRIGLAVSDETETIATPWRVLDAEGERAQVQAIVDAVRERGIERVVIGLPLRMDGGQGPAAEKARAFGDRIKAVSPVPVLYWDERFSTVTAQQALIEGGARRRKRKQVVDKLAAQIILQHYLDAQAGLPVAASEPG